MKRTKKLGYWEKIDERESGEEGWYPPLWYQEYMNEEKTRFDCVCSCCYGLIMETMALDECNLVSMN